jgi:hypothetical protein
MTDCRPVELQFTANFLQILEEIRSGSHKSPKNPIKKLNCVPERGWMFCQMSECPD